jgi:hypothetical protein
VSARMALILIEQRTEHVVVIKIMAISYSNSFKFQYFVIPSTQNLQESQLFMIKRLNSVPGFQYNLDIHHEKKAIQS